jgi:uncharacterized protein YkwD
MRLLRLVALIAVAGYVLVPNAGAATRESRTPQADGSLADAIVTRINEVRADAGVRALTLSSALARASTSHALSMATVGFFSHSSEDGTSYTRRIARFYERHGARHLYKVGEDILWSARTLTAEGTVTTWLASSSHRRTLLSGRFRELGVGVFRAAGAPGFFGGRDVTIVVVDFGAR